MTTLPSESPIKTAMQKKVLADAQEKRTALENGTAQVDSEEDIMLLSVKELLVALNEKLQEELPDISDVLNKLNLQLRKRPELTYMLTDEEIQPLYEAYMRKSFAKKEEKKSKGKGGKKFGSSPVDSSGNSVADLVDKLI